MIKYYVGKQERNMTADLLRARCARLGIHDVESIQTLTTSWSCVVNTQHHAELLDECAFRMLAIREDTLRGILSFRDASGDDEWGELLDEIEKALL